MFHQIGTGVATPNAATTIGATSGTVTINVPPGRILRLRGISFTSDLPCTLGGFIIKGSYGSATTGSTRQEIGFSSGGYGRGAYISYDGILLFEGGVIQGTLSFGDPDKTKIAGAATYRSNYKFIPSADMLTFDRNWNADFQYLALGDSITEGHTMGNYPYASPVNVYYGKWNFPTVVRDSLIESGIDVRLTNMGWSGS